MSALDATGLEIRRHLEAIRKLFKPGKQITLLVRTPGHPIGWVLTDDRLDEAIGALAILMFEEKQKKAPPPRVFARNDGATRLMLVAGDPPCNGEIT